MRRIIVITLLAMAATSCAGPGIAPLTLATPTPAAPPTAARQLASMSPGPVVLQDKLVYFRTSTSPLTSATAIPKDPNDTFMIVAFALPSNSNLYPEDLDWTFRDQADRERRAVGFGIPLKYDTEQNTPVLYSLFGRLIAGPALVYSTSDRAIIGLVFVVPKGTVVGTIWGPRTQTYTFSIQSTALSLDNAQIATMKCASTCFEQPTGSESWSLAQE